MQSIIFHTSQHLIQQTASPTVLANIIDQIKNNFTDQLPSNHDLQVIQPDPTTIKIEQIRQLLTELSYKTRAASPRVIFLWQAELMTIPAQNALLKSLEEPPENTFLILVTSQPGLLLPTIKSRCLMIRDQNTNTTSPQTPNLDELIAQLIKPSSYAQFIDVAAKYSDRAEAQTLVDQLISAIHQQPAYPNPQLIKILQALIQAQADLGVNVNVKLALENCFFEIKNH